MTIGQELRRWYRFLWIGLTVVGVLAGSWRASTRPSYYFRMAILVRPEPRARGSGVQIICSALRYERIHRLQLE